MEQLMAIPKCMFAGTSRTIRNNAVSMGKEPTLKGINILSQ
jgi:hypothetical protein